MPRLSKRKFNTAERATDLTFGDGIPLVERTITETGPSIPSEEEHPAVDFEEKPFGLLSRDIFNGIQGDSSGISTMYGRVRYASENDIAGLVKNFVFHILSSMGYGDDAEVHSEVATFSIRPDLWVVSIRGIPVGVIEVKKPDVPGKPSAMSHPNVLGELFDFMKHLPNFYGVHPVFGILTNFQSWRIAWLPDEATDSLAAESVEFDDDGEGVQEETGKVAKIQSKSQREELRELRPTASRVNPIIHAVEEEGPSTEDEKENVDSVNSRKGFLHVSKVFHRHDPETLLAVCSAIVKMCEAKISPFSNPFDKLSQRTLLKFTKGNDSVVWTRLDVAPMWNKAAHPKKYLYAVEDLGRGANGRVWLVCTSSGAVGVLKFSLSDDPGKSLDAEYDMWKIAYPSMAVYREVWCKHEALRMPHFAVVQPVDRRTKIPLIRQTLESDFHQHGIVHEDVFWRNIGIYVDNNGDEKIVVYDMGSVRPASQGESSSWIDTAIAALY